MIEDMNESIGDLNMRWEKFFFTTVWTLFDLWQMTGIDCIA